MVAQATSRITPENPYKRAARLFDFKGMVKGFRAKESLFCEGDLAHHVYRILGGVVRSFSLLADGRRQIESFRLPGDLFGFDGNRNRQFSAEAIDDVVTLIGSRNTILARAAIDCNAAQELLAATETELQRTQRHAMLLAMNAHQRVASFLLEMSERLGQKEVLELRMSRQDIADYLGLTIETVSRMLTQFEEARLIGSRTSRYIALLNRSALRRVAE
jgi:CRP/FNR family nitrogen fixation transcriptional regulator